MKNTDKKSTEAKLTLKCEKIKLLNTRTGIKTGAGIYPNPTMLCGEPKTFICWHQP